MTDLIVITGLLILTYITGKKIEKKHFRQLRKNEADLSQKIVVLNSKTAPGNLQLSDPTLCSGAVVIGCSYFKRFISMWKMLIGGRIPTLETLVERARREAVVRMMQSAKESGADIVVNTRIETITLGRGHGDKGLSMVEAFAYGTACKSTDNS